ncbi:MAG: carbohydrate-binding protein [Candidatus Acidiferrales bacterium]
MMPRIRFLLTGLVLFTYFQATGITAGGAGHYQGKPFEDSVYHGGPQKIPGRVECAYYDLGGEGVAYHDVDAKNGGSGSLNPVDGTYLNQFRMNEAVGISYTKFRRETQIDDNPYDKVLPPENQLYVGWTQPGEWFNMTVKVARSGVYTIDLMYTSRQGGTISLDRNGKKLTGPLQIVSTADPAETIAWRQWHHWNLMKDMAEVKLPKGVSVLTLRVLTEGNMNFAYLDFEPKGRD